MVLIQHIRYENPEVAEINLCDCDTDPAMKLPDVITAPMRMQNARDMLHCERCES